ncbi:MAG: golvesin C-terminal-like domain-containing protein [Planctomycetota bacterium]
MIIDNGDSGTSYTGTWKSSGGADPYGGGSLYGRDGATYTWSAGLTGGMYEVFMWWTEFSSRSDAIPVEIYTANGTYDSTVNQQTNGGQWNSLGQFDFNSSASVKLFAPEAYPTSYSVDAVMFVPVEVTPVNAGFIASPTSGDIPLTVSFTNQSSGSISSYQWDFDNDGDIDSTSPNPSFQYTQDGTYTVRLVVSGAGGQEELVKTDYIVAIDPTVPEEIIVDNGDSDTSSTGTWGVSSGENPFGSNSLWARDDADYTWYVTPEQGGTYEVSLWWTEFSSRGASVPVTVSHRYGATNLTVNQQSSGGQWNSLGSFKMLAGQTYSIKVHTSGDGSTSSADAVRVDRISN